MNNSKPLLIVAALGSGSLIGPACAAPITLGAPFLIVDDRAANDQALLQANLCPSATTQSFRMEPAERGSGANHEPLDGCNGYRELAFVGSTAIPNQFSGAVAYQFNLIGPWTLNFSNGSQYGVFNHAFCRGGDPTAFRIKRYGIGVQRQSNFCVELSKSQRGWSRHKYL